MLGGPFKTPLELAEHDAEQLVPPGRLRERAAVAGQARQLLARRMEEAVAQTAQRPQAEARTSATNGLASPALGRHSAGGGERRRHRPRVHGAEQRSVLHMCERDFRPQGQ